PENLSRMKRRESYETNPEHDTLKNKREKRDELKEKKYQAQLKKEQTVKEEK
ncbi:lysine 2,3-aminomutase, partial [Bacillus altitudinis]|nr:lysine 2,3-aminomutase [Bacillus altitudinis]